MELLIPTVTEVVEESEDVLDAEAIKNIEDVKTIKKLDAEIEEKSEESCQKTFARCWNLSAISELWK